MYITEFTLLLLITLSISLFIWNKWRYDVVAIITLLSCVILRLIPTEQAFTGFSNPAVITVACIMIISHTITNSGVLQPVVIFLKKFSKNTTIYLGLLVSIAAILSAFMNNVGALALMMPIAIQISRQNDTPLSTTLMPLAFGSVLGGLCTAIGTPPNLLISSFRMVNTGEPFHLLDFTYLGIVIASLSIIFIVFLGWRLIPIRKSDSSPNTLHQLLDYLSEIRVKKDSSLIGSNYNNIEIEFEQNIICIGFIRNNRKRLHITKYDRVHEGDILIIETSSEELKQILQNKYFEIIGDLQPTEIIKSDSVSIVEAVVPLGSRMEKRSFNSMRLRNRFQINILGISREGKYIKDRIQQNKLHAGDVILIQGDSENLIEITNNLGLIPLSQHVTPKATSKKFLPILTFIIAILLTATHIMQIQIALSCAVLALLIMNILTLREMYDAVEWPIIILLGSMIPLGLAIQTTGTSAMIANFMLNMTSNAPPILILGIIIIVTMTLSDVMNNAATTVIMAPISITIADSLNLNPDTFLMAVAIGASCSFLTPISHQNNTLVLGPGGYHFTDYMRLGLPLEILILIITLPLLPIVWPLEIITVASAT